jgi:hypothetical protein
VLAELLVVLLIGSAVAVELGVEPLGVVELVCELLREVLVGLLVVTLKLEVEAVVVAVELLVRLRVIADTFRERMLVTSTVPGHRQAYSSRDE